MASDPETTGPRVHPGCVEAYGLGAAAFPDGAEHPPVWWPAGIRGAYADGWWHSLWTAEAEKRERTQAEHEQHLAAFDLWEGMTNRQREDEIRRAM